VIVGVGDLPGLHKKYFPAVETGGVTYACHTWNSSGLFGLFFCREALRHSVIAHEIQHCVLRIAEYTGWSINGHTTEPSAFLSGWLARLLYRDLARHAEKIANN
jgi:hypothetical protein